MSAGTYLICARPGEVAFNRESEYWFDVEVFEQNSIPSINCSSHIVSEVTAQLLEKILPLYSGELLELYYDDWALREGEHLRAIYLKNLIFPMHYYKCQRGHEKASVYGQQVLVPHQINFVR